MCTYGGVKCIHYLFTLKRTQMNLASENSVEIIIESKYFIYVSIYLFTHSIFCALSVIWFLCWHIPSHFQAYRHRHKGICTHIHGTHTNKHKHLFFTLRKKKNWICDVCIEPKKKNIRQSSSRQLHHLFFR